MHVSVRSLLCSLFLCYLHAAPGCMDNSYHLTRNNDPKEFHYVSCNCPCQKQYRMFANGTCSKCRHFQDPRMSTRRINVVGTPATTIDVKRLRAAVAHKLNQCHSLL